MFLTKLSIKKNNSEMSLSMKKIKNKNSLQNLFIKKKPIKKKKKFFFKKKLMARTRYVKWRVPNM